ncbi:MAG: hypothetical protein WA324_21460 [Bryobacteraceae bacterium]
MTAKAVERVAESIGEDIEARQQQDIQCAKQLSLPVLAGPPIPFLYVQMDGTQVFAVKSETEGCAGRTPGQPARTRECKLGAVFTQTGVDDQGRPVRDEDSTPMWAPSRAPKSLVSVFIPRLGIGVGTAPPSA